MTAAIILKNLHKSYPLYKKPIHRFLHIFNKNIKEVGTYHALKGLNIELPKGESIGVLGKNGAGKSTLLKIITGVVTPTEGECIVNGSISAILELNAGFDTGLTGLENIFLKGTYIGYTDDQIRERLDDIVDFADLGDHINQPVRTYSSGMKSRLGFAIAVHVDPDILIIDEALSVGDEMFKVKCLNKIKQFKEEGKTILFVSHSLGQIKSFCSKAMWLKDGVVEQYGDVREVVTFYEDYLKQEKAKIKAKSKAKSKNRVYKIETLDDYIEKTDFYLTNKSGKRVRKFDMGEDITFHIDYIMKQEINNPRFSWALLDAEKRELFGTDKQSEQYVIDNSIGTHHISVTLPNISLLPGRYLLMSSIRDETGVFEFFLSKQQHFVIKPTRFLGTGSIYVEHDVKQDIVSDAENNTK